MEGDDNEKFLNGNLKPKPQRPTSQAPEPKDFRKVPKPALKPFPGPSEDFLMSLLWGPPNSNAILARS